MTQKQALKQLEEYCKVNNLHLIQGTLNRQVYAITKPDNGTAGARVIDYDGKYYTLLSRYLTPKELLLWIDGYHAGLQAKASM